ncbi:MAG: FAD:protein FMN transferase [Gemmatimonadota bacterium]|nr:MAG: FAD:protein FMN transferase [Gemmatimonadota bacterium]
MKRLPVSFVLFCVIFAAISIWRYRFLRTHEVGSTERTKVLMDTLVRIEIFDKDEGKSRATLELAFEEIERLDHVFSRYLAESEVSSINRNAGRDAVMVSKDVIAVLQRSIHFSEISKGAFDVTVGAVSQLWDFTSAEPTLPEQARTEEQLEHVDYGKIMMSNGRHVGLSDSGMAIDLGGVAKGYAVDRALQVLKENGVASSLVDAGGDIGLLGSKPDGKLWRIGVQHPRDMQRMIAVIEIDSGSVATSGDYERYFMRDGRRYHHILDPKTGWPARNCMSATIVTKRAMDADILATAVFVLGPEKGLAFIEGLPGVEGLLLFEEGGQIEHAVSGGLGENITFNK